MQDLCRQLEQGLSLWKACDAVADSPHPSTVLDWTEKYPDTLGQQYAHARETGYRLLADKILEIADEPIPSTESGALDNGAVAHQRLRIDTRKWMLSKMLPKVYGDKVTQEHTGAGGGPIALAAVDLKNLSDEELANMQRLLSKVGGGAV
jgi:hypothetical protein